MLKLSKTILSLAVVLFLNACVSHNGHYSAISNKPLSLYDIKKDNTVLVRGAKGLDARHVVVIIPSGKAPTIADAVAEILNKYHGDYLANATIENKSFQLMWMYHYTSWRVTGDVMRLNP